MEISCPYLRDSLDRFTCCSHSLQDDIYDDEIQDEGNEDDCDEEYGNGLSVEALAEAAAALRGQSSGGNIGSSGELKFNWKQVGYFSCIQLICYCSLFYEWLNVLK